MIGMLVAYDDEGSIFTTLDQVGAYDGEGWALGSIDFAAYEAAGGELTDIWIATQVGGGSVRPAKGSKTWPEWLGDSARDFRVELTGAPGKKRITALVHKTSGHRRERAAIEAAITAVVPNADGAKDIRHLVGGPDRPLRLDDQGRTAPRTASGTPAHLPLVAMAR